MRSISVHDGHREHQSAISVDSSFSLLLLSAVRKGSGLAFASLSPATSSVVEVCSHTRACRGMSLIVRRSQSRHQERLACGRLWNVLQFAGC